MTEINLDVQDISLSTKGMNNKLGNINVLNLLVDLITKRVLENLVSKIKEVQEQSNKTIN